MIADTEYLSNDAENSALHHRNKWDIEYIKLENIFQKHKNITNPLLSIKNKNE